MSSVCRAAVSRGRMSAIFDWLSRRPSAASLARWFETEPSCSRVSPICWRVRAMSAVNWPLRPPSSEIRRWYSSTSVLGANPCSFSF